MEQFAGRDWPDVVLADGDQGHRVPAPIDKLDLVAPTAPVDVHHGSNVSTTKPLMRRITIKNDEGMLRNHD